METAERRGSDSVILIGLLLGPFALMLWLGKGRLAWLYLLIQFVVLGLVFAATATGVIAPIVLFGSLSITLFVLSLPVTIAGLIHGMRRRQVWLERPWYSRWDVAIVLPLVAGLLIASGVRDFFYQPFSAPSGSMVPALMVGDHFFVSKTAYGYSRYSFDYGFDFSGRIWGTEPERGDVVVFKLPRDNATDYIKRLIGLPGDHIQMRDGVLYINGVAVPKQRIADFVDEKSEGSGQPIPQYVETLPNGLSYRILDVVPNGAADNTEEYVVPPGHYFMLGDNRDNSLDSRFAQDAPGGGVGFVPYENLIGPVALIYWNYLGIRIDDRLQGYPQK